ncbi:MULTISPECIES: LysR substrate-binding domain-containing protein [unclassified Burkholderia]|uniref:LysR substrate-binding domain-containing protein n=1 Tax=unclassified Burkholderia TaxID=2613784 RepID=UPI000754CAA9|nr:MULTISPECIES: LysR substrate-binding domain-containing protein [unclassified Burkholderia]KUY54620.1 LysR family transcriptional regulator [Burkholderia sp. RF2-non_BP3]KUY72504.1 LysR family transcriptional regulator [Burkholderia sp. RF4-BP95]
MRELPPLNAVKAFEVAARTGSFALAAADLGVSSAAVSQQVRNLEAYLGKQLFVRNGNRISLTDAGRAIFPQTSRALRDIATMTERILEGELQAHLVVSVPSSLTETWLVPKLTQLFEIYPQIAIDIRVEEDPVDLLRQNVDIRVSYGDYHYPSIQTIPLVHDEVIPVCAPEFWHRHGNGNFSLNDIHESLFIHTNWGPNYASHPTWNDWFARIDNERHLDPSNGRRVGLSSLAITMARSGLGIALAQKLLAQADLETGRLIALSTHSIQLGHPYCAFVPRMKAERPELRRLVRLLCNEDHLD